MLKASSERSSHWQHISHSWSPGAWSCYAKQRISRKKLHQRRIIQTFCPALRSIPPVIFSEFGRASLQEHFSELVISIASCKMKYCTPIGVGKIGVSTSLQRKRVPSGAQQYFGNILVPFASGIR
mmetsp:Transcript_29636/g.62077  ORF Transcript_29636/g.62077 Transcript_29636/m.62077 type:complete len:125 (-) Transcript_29636:1396-1770(-)